MFKRKCSMVRENEAEKILSMANEYLKQRNFLENNDVKSETLNEVEGQVSSEEQAGLNALISPSSPNSFTFSTTSSQYAFIEQQYIRLKSWMTEGSEPCRSELSQVLFPLFVHLFLELLTGAGKQLAKYFFNRHHQVFRVNRDYEQTLRQVWNAANETTPSPVIHSLKKGKYQVRLSELTMNYFLRYLQTSGNPTLLQIFSNFIEVELHELSGSSSLPSLKQSFPDFSESKPHIAMAEDMDCSLDELTQIKDIISNVQKLKPVMPSVCVYSVINAFNGLSCAQVNGCSSLLACGFEDSVIKLWRLTARSENSFGSSGGGAESVLFCDMSRVEERRGVLHTEREEEEETKTLGGRYVSGGEFCALRGHRGPVNDLSFSHCSSFLFSVGEDATMRLWDLHEQRTSALYSGHQYPVWCVDVSPHTLYVATGSYDETVRLWSPECRYPLRTLVGHSNSVNCVTFHPNCNYIASGSADRSIRMWQVCDGNVVRILFHHSAPVKFIAFSPNGKFLASGSDKGEVVVWDLAAGKVLCQVGVSSAAGGVTPPPTPCPPHKKGSIASLGWSKDSRLLFCAFSDGHIKGYHLDALDDTYDLHEIGNMFCGSPGLGISLIRASLNVKNFLSVMVAVQGER